MTGAEIALIAGIGSKLLGGLFGESPQEARQKFIRAMIRKAEAGYQKGLKSRGARYARMRVLSDVDRRSEEIRALARGEAERGQERIMRRTGVAGAGLAEATGRNLAIQGDVKASQFLVGSLAGMEKEASAQALQEAEQRKAMYLAAIYGQPLQSPAAFHKNSPWDYVTGGIAGFADYYGKYGNQNQMEYVAPSDNQMNMLPGDADPNDAGSIWNGQDTYA